MRIAWRATPAAADFASAGDATGAALAFGRLRRAAAADLHFPGQSGLVGLVCGLLLLPIVLGFRRAFARHIADGPGRRFCRPGNLRRTIIVVRGWAQAVIGNLRSGRRSVTGRSGNAATRKRQCGKNQGNAFRNHHDTRLELNSKPKRPTLPSVRVLINARMSVFQRPE
jgi:hypothetical protein